ncbi:MAG TPA: mevalonate kinase, partial [Gammaproteobacteria bacterium]|nr:mevalonate kinase [Gammaproteobacteria bacterium]
MLYKASAPGSLMLMGEYAVLYGKQALVCAVDKRMTVTIIPRDDKSINFHSPRLGEWSTDIKNLKITKPFSFITGCLYKFRRYLQQGCDIYIEAEFCDQVGLGSSAAVTVATLAALKSWLGAPIDMLRHAREVIRSVQGTGSGADAAASIYGGIVAYRANPLQAEKLDVTPALTVLYSGSKTPTVDAIKIVQDAFAGTPKLFKTICNAI